MSTKGGSGGGGKVHPDGKGGIAVSWLGVLRARWSISRCMHKWT